MAAAAAAAAVAGMAIRVDQGVPAVVAPEVQAVPVVVAQGVPEVPAVVAPGVLGFSEMEGPAPTV